MSPWLLTALASGRPVIATRGPGRTLLIDEHVNGCLVAPCDGGELSAAVQLLARRPELLAAMGRASRLKAERQLDARPINGVLLAALGLA
jgi:glycosyltransferase involved in cell wall biosynthesis